MNAMLNAAGNELGDNFSGFSADWLKDDTGDNRLYKKNNNKRLSAVKSERPFANRNISSIVSKIRDDGAAFSSDEGLDNKQTLQKPLSGSVKETPIETTMTFADACDDDVVSFSSNLNKASQTVSPEHKKNRELSKSSFSAVCDQPVDVGVNQATVTTVEPVQKKIRKKQIALISAICFSVIAVFGYMSYQFKLQSEDMQQTLLMYKQAMNEEKPNQEKIHAVSSVSVNHKTVSILQQAEPALITEKKNTISTAMGAAIPVDIENVMVAEKKSEINAPLTAAVENKKIAVKSSLLKKVAVKTYTAADRPVMFTVNLASFSDEAKAYSQLAVLESLGVSSVVEPAVVNNKTIYRLCVEGFSSREEASLFISHLNKKYAVNAWVRQS